MRAGRSYDEACLKLFYSIPEEDCSDGEEWYVFRRLTLGEIEQAREIFRDALNNGRTVKPGDVFGFFLRWYPNNARVGVLEYQEGNERMKFYIDVD